MSCPAAIRGRWRECAGWSSSFWRAPVRRGRLDHGDDLSEMRMIRMTSTRWMPRRRGPRKDAATRRNAPGRRWQPGIRRSPNGATRPGHARAPGRAIRGGPRELKHLSTARRREDSLSSGERRGRSPNHAGGTACRRCLCGVGRVCGRARQRPRRRPDLEPKTAGTGHRRG